MASVGGFFKSIEHGLKVIFGNLKALALEATIAELLLPGFRGMIESAKDAIIQAETNSIAAGVQTGTGAQKFAIALTQFATGYEAWAKLTNFEPTNAHKQAVLQKVFELIQLAPEFTDVFIPLGGVPAGGPAPVLPGTPTK